MAEDICVRLFYQNRFVGCNMFPAVPRKGEIISVQLRFIKDKEVREDFIVVQVRYEVPNEKKGLFSSLVDTNKTTVRVDIMDAQEKSN